MFGFLKKKSAPAPTIERKHANKGGPSILPKRRNFDAGILDDSTHSFIGAESPINESLRHNLRLMRNRSRDLMMNNDYGRKFIKMVKSNVVGANGIKLQARTTFKGGTRPDLADNAAIESAWDTWGDPEFCSLDGKLSWVDIQNLVIGTVAQDGESLTQMIETPGQGFGLTLKQWPVESLDINYNEVLPNGNHVVMGIEYDRVGRVINYHLQPEPVRSWVNIYPTRDYVAVPARDMIHLHITDHVNQARGIPWAHSAIRRLHKIGKYEDAELIAAFFGAAKMGAIYSDDGETTNVDDLAPDGEEMDEGAAYDELEAGSIMNLAHGEKFEGFDPTHPTTAFDGFMRAVLRGAASGLNVAYPGISNDLENVNFSSIRAGVLEERDNWRAVQTWFLTHFHKRIYRRWLPWSILSGELALPMGKVDSKYQKVTWQPRGWAWVDPKKDSDANMQNVRLGVMSRQDILAAEGRDFEEVLEKLKWENERAAEMGVNISDWEDSATIEAGGNPDED